MIKAKLGHRLDEWVRVVFPFLFSRRLDPNALTIVGAIGSLVAATAFATGSFVAGGILILVSGFFDLVDGVVARHNNTSTRFGAFLDSTLDRFADMAILVGMATHYASRGEAGHVLLVGTALTSAVLVSYSSACARITVPDSMNVGVFERGERVGLLALGALTGFVVPALWIVAAGSMVTLAQRFARAHREMQRLDAADRLGEQT